MLPRSSRRTLRIRPTAAVPAGGDGPRWDIIGRHRPFATAGITALGRGIRCVWCEVVGAVGVAGLSKEIDAGSQKTLSG